MASITEGTPNTTASGTFDVSIPAHTAGDLLVLQVAKNQGSSSAPAVSTAGWTTDIQQPNSTATNHILVAHKIGDGSESTVRVTNMAGGVGLIGKVIRVAGVDAGSLVVGTPVYDTNTGTSTIDMDVGTAASGDIAFTTICFANTVSSPALDNGFTLDESSSYYVLGYKILSSTDDSVTATWTTSRNYRAGHIVFKAASSTGTIAVTLDDATSTASGVHSIAGSAAVTLDDATMVANGAHASGSTGTIAVTLDGAAMEASGIHSTVGTIAVTLDDATGTAAGTHTTVGSIAVTLDDATMSASGAITYTGTITATLDDATMTASGGPEIAGQITTTTDNATMAAYGEAVDLQAIIHIYRSAERRMGLGVKHRLVPRVSSARVAGDVAVTLSDAVMSATAVHSVAGTVDVVLADAVSSSDGTVGVVGAGTFTVDDATSSASGSVHPTGTISVALDDATMSATGNPQIAGTIAVTLADATSTAVGFAAVTGTVAAILEDAVSTATAGHGASGSIATTLAGATMAAGGQVGVGGDGIDFDRTLGEYAWTPHATALNPSTELDVIVFAAATDWTPAANQALAAKWSAAGNHRSWGLNFNTGGTLVLNLSANGSTSSVLTAAPAAPFANGGAGYWVRATWRSSDGFTAIYAVPATSISDPVPSNWGTAINTGTKLAGQVLNPSSTANLTLGAINDGTSMSYDGMIRYAEVRHAIGGAPVWRLDARTYPNGTTSFTESVAGRTVTKAATGTEVPVGMPLGTEAPNVGPTAAVLGHTPVPYSALPSQQITKVISTAVANAQPTTVVTSDGVTRRVFEKLNVTVAVQVTSTTPVLIRDSKIGRVTAHNGTDVWVEWSDIGYGYARTGDDPCLPATIWNGTDMTFATPPSWNGVKTLGSGADTITVNDEGDFTGECTSVSASTAVSRLTVYRCNMWGHTDANFIGGKIPGSLDSLAECIIEESWWHDYLWFPRDQSRVNQPDGGNSHCDGAKVNASKLVIWRKCRVDMWPVVTADVQNLQGPYWRGPHWGKNPNNSDWPLQRSDVPGRKFLPIAFIINNQAGGNSKNNLYEDCIVSGPFGNFFQFGSKFEGTTYQQNITIRRCRFLSGVTAGGTPFVQPRSGFMSGPNNTPASFKWHWPVTGPDVNYGVDGNPITTPPKAGFLNDSSFTPT